MNLVFFSCKGLEQTDDGLGIYELCAQRNKIPMEGGASRGESFPRGELPEEVN